MLFPGNESTVVLESMGQQFYPLWSEGSVLDLSTNRWYYNFALGVVDPNVETKGKTIAWDFVQQMQVASWDTPYWWKLAYDPDMPDTMFGVSISFVQQTATLQRLDMTSGKLHDVAMFPDGYWSPSNDAVYDPSTKILYAFLCTQRVSGCNAAIIGMNVTNGKVVSQAAVRSDTYVCEIQRDNSTDSATYFGVAMNQNTNNAYLATIDPKTAAVHPVGTAEVNIEACDADGQLALDRGLYFAYVKKPDSSYMTVWNTGDGSLHVQFPVETFMFGISYLSFA